MAYKQKVNTHLTASVAEYHRFHYTGLVGGVYGMDVYRLSS